MISISQIKYYLDGRVIGMARRDFSRAVVRNDKEAAQTVIMGRLAPALFRENNFLRDAVDFFSEDHKAILPLVRSLELASVGQLSEIFADRDLLFKTLNYLSFGIDMCGMLQTMHPIIEAHEYFRDNGLTPPSMFGDSDLSDIADRKIRNYVKEYVSAKNLIADTRARIFSKIAQASDEDLLLSIMDHNSHIALCVLGCAGISEATRDGWFTVMYERPLMEGMGIMWIPEEEKAAVICLPSMKKQLIGESLDSILYPGYVSETERHLEATVLAAGEIDPKIGAFAEAVKDALLGDPEIESRKLFYMMNEDKFNGSGVREETAAVLRRIEEEENRILFDTYKSTDRYFRIKAIIGEIEERI